MHYRLIAIEFNYQRELEFSSKNASLYETI